MTVIFIIMLLCASTATLAQSDYQLCSYDCGGSGVSEHRCFQAGVVPTNVVCPNTVLASSPNPPKCVPLPPEECLSRDCVYGSMSNTNHCFTGTFLARLTPKPKISGAYHGLEGLDSPMISKVAATYNMHNTTSSTRGLMVHHSFLYTHPSSAKRVHLRYEVTHTRKSEIVNIDFVDAIIAARCAMSVIELVVDTSSSLMMRSLLRRLHIGALITGRPEWMCVDALGKRREPVSVSRMVEHVHVSTLPHSQRAILTIKTSPALPVHFFESAHVRSKVGVFPPDQFKTTSFRHPPATVSKTIARHHHPKSFGSWFSSALKFCGGLIHKVVSWVTQEASPWLHFFEFIVTGDFAIDKVWTLGSVSWNFDENSHGAVNKSVYVAETTDCIDCFFHYDVEVDWGFDIEEYSLHKAYLYGEGDLNVNLAAHSNVTAMYNFTTQRNIANITLSKPICFMVGVVPICISVTIPVNLGLSLFAEADAYVQGRVSAVGELKVGVAYSPKDSQLHALYEHNVQHTGGLNTSASVQVSGQVFLLASFIFLIDHIGGPVIGVQPGLDVSAIWQSYDSPCNPDGYAGLSMAVNADLKVTLGGVIDIDILHHQVFYKDLGQKTVYTGKWPIDSWCLLVNRDLRYVDYDDDMLSELLAANDATDPTWVFPNMAFEGVAENVGGVCSSVPAARFHVNVLDDLSVIIAANNAYNESIPPFNASDTPHPYNVRTTNSDVAKAAFPGTLVPFPFTQTFDTEVLNPVPFEQGYGLVPLSGWAIMANDYSVLWFNSSNPCYQPSTLHRVAPSHRDSRETYIFNRLQPYARPRRIGGKQKRRGSGGGALHVKAARFQLQAYGCARYFWNVCFDLMYGAPPPSLNDTDPTTTPHRCEDGSAGDAYPEFSFVYNTANECNAHACNFGCQPVIGTGGAVQPNVCVDQQQPMPNGTQPGPRPDPHYNACEELVEQGACQCTPSSMPPGQPFYMVNCYGLTNVTNLARVTFPPTKVIIVQHLANNGHLINEDLLANQPYLEEFTLETSQVQHLPRGLLSPGKTNGHVHQFKLSGLRITSIGRDAFDGNDWLVDPTSQTTSLIDISNNDLRWVPSGTFDHFMDQTHGYNAQLVTSGNPWINEGGMCKCKNSTLGGGLSMRAYLGAMWCECSDPATPGMCSCN